MFEIYSVNVIVCYVWMALHLIAVCLLFPRVWELIEVSATVCPIWTLVFFCIAWPMVVGLLMWWGGWWVVGCMILSEIFELYKGYRMEKRIKRFS